MNNVVNSLKELIIEDVTCIYKFMFLNMFKISVLLNFLFTILVILRFNKYKEITWCLILIEVILLLLLLISLVVKKENNKMPLPRKRFTKKVGFEVRVNKADFQEMILYMYNLEQYIEENKINENKV